MIQRPRLLAPVLVAGVLAGVTGAVLRRMEAEYVSDDALSKSTVVMMYTTYSAYAAALLWAGSRRIWPVRLPVRPFRTAGKALAIAGSGIAFAGARPFGAGAQISGVESGSLHVAGAYRYSRNPQYLGLVLAATGTAVTARSAYAGLLAAGMWAAYRRWIPSEERHLTRVFGNEYQARVGRWL